MWFIPFSFRDFIDVLIVALLLFWLYRRTRINNVPIIIAGVFSISAIWVFARAFNMELLSKIFEQIISVGVIALVILFQPELRKLLQSMSMRRHRFGFLSRIFGIEQDSATRAFMPIIEAATELSRQHRGGIIVIAGSSDLTLITEGGVEVDARLSSALLKSIFIEGSPLSEGAVVVSSRRIIAAKCILPVTQSDVPISLGMRHRAAIGLSEISDAIIIVVSQQTGDISLVRAGNIIRDLSASDLAQELILCFDPRAKSDIDKEVVQ